MEVIQSVKELRQRLKREPQVACVPTMGNIHDGHLRLVTIAQQHAPFVVTTIFVNRLQFGQGEDFDKYPRTFEDDCDKLAADGCTWCSIPTRRRCIRSRRSTWSIRRRSPTSWKAAFAPATSAAWPPWC